MTIFLEIVLMLLSITVLFGLWIVFFIEFDKAIFKGHFLKRVRAHYGVDE